MKLILSKRLLCDLELLLNGSFAPLTGFLDKHNYESVIHNMELIDGSPWSIPIVLPVTDAYKNESIIELYDHDDKNHIANLSVHSFYKPNIDLECELVLGTTDINHPYVRVMKSWGDDIYYAGGRVTLVNKITHYNYLEHRFTPQETKQYFRDNFWNYIIGFQPQHPMHRYHYELTRQSMYDTGPKTKLLLHPIVGVTDDYTVRVNCYKHILKYYDPNTVLLSLLPLSMRMAGHRDVMWYALIRKNYGCTHFLVTNEGDYDSHDLGIEIVKSKILMYVDTLKKYLTKESLEIMTVNPFKFKTKSISDDEFIRLLRTGEDIPTWFSYPEIVAELRQLYCIKNES
jgi:sulfate adenylyltransferase